MKPFGRAACLLMAAAFLAVFAAGCAPYRSSYRAVGFVHTNTAEEAGMSFFEFEGTMVFRLPVQRGEKIECIGKLGTGSASVRAAINDHRDLELFTVGAGMPEENCLFEPNDTGVVWIVIATTEKCMNGEFTFNVHE